MHFLLANDDGIDAPGLEALERAIAAFGRITVVAPSTSLSECSHRVSTKHAIRVSRLSDRRYAADGTPADCVRLGLAHLAPDADWVAAGINRGGNLGVDVHLSGTVAAAREAAILGKPAVAFSHYRRPDMPIDWAAAARMAADVFGLLHNRPPEPGAFWNVNFPHLAPDEPPPEIVFCPLDRCPLPVDYEVDGDEYRYRGVYHDRLREPGTDVDHCFSGRITVTQVLP
jgi:5'-nucleotidase